MSIENDAVSAPAERAARRLAAHRWVDAARVESGRVVLTPARTALAVHPGPGELMTEYLRHWSEIYDSVYSGAGLADARSAPVARRPTDLDFAGWHRSDTGEPFDAAHMRDWADRAAEIARQGEPRWVLEIGCGTGLLACRLCDHVRGYVGTDIVPSVLATLRAAIDGPVAFVSAAAHEAEGARIRSALDAVGCPPAGPDRVLLNSVVQYFPDLEYLRVVLRAAVRLVAPGGRVIVGDVRHAGLRERYCEWAERAADPGAAPAEIARRASVRASGESELLVDPVRLAHLLVGVAAETGRQVWLSVHPKRMRADTELTRYRFDAVLVVDPPSVVSEPPTVDWSRIGPARLRLEALADRMTREPVWISGIPNRLLVSHPTAATPYQLELAIRGTGAAVVLDPVDPTALGVVYPGAVAAQRVGRLASRGPGTAHEPFGTFVRRRLLQVAREVLRAEGLDTLELPVTVGPPPTGAEIGGGTNRSSGLECNENQYHLGSRCAVGRAADDDARGRTGTEGGLPMDRTSGAAADQVSAVDPGLGGLVQAASGAGAEALGDIDLPGVLAVADRLDEVALLAMAYTLGRCRWLFDRPERPHSLSEIYAATAVAPRHRRIVRRWLRALTGVGMLTAGPEGYRGLHPVSATELEKASTDLEYAVETLEYGPAMSHFLLSSVAYLPELLRDEIRLQTLLFSEGNLDVAEAVYRENVGSRYINGAAAALLRGIATRGTHVPPLRVLEVGAGIGGTTHAALAALAEVPVDYLFTDVSRFFLATASRRFSRPEMRYGVLDINKDLAAQGYRRGCADVVLAANVLHNARHAGRVLAALRELVEPAGWVVFIDTSRDHLQLMTSMEFLMSPPADDPEADFEDFRRGTDRLFPSRQEWLETMRAAGFDPVAAAPEESEPVARFAQFVYIGRPAAG
ncbi:methyltransferase [Actinomycetes bacterium KLBMP 9797]